jgi:tetratricopeptide (TPR) repeat protein
MSASAPTPAALRAEASALDTAGYVAVSQGEYELGQRRFERELALYRQLGDPRGIATGLRGCGFTAMQRGNLDRARQCVEQSLEISQSANDRSGYAWSLFDLGYLALLRGEFGPAQALLDASVLEFREQSNLYGLHRALFALARIKDESGDTAQARAYYRDGLLLQQKMRYLQVTADGLEGLAGIFAREGMPDRAVRLFGAAHRHRAATAIQRWEHTNAWYARDLALARSQLDLDAWHEHWASGYSLDQEQAVAYALSAS